MQELIVQTTKFSCKISIDIESNIVSTEKSLIKFQGAKLSQLRSWLFKIDPTYQIASQLTLGL